MDYLAHLRSDSDRFARALAACDPAAPVPSCPDWTAADLLWHLGEVQLFWGTIVAERLDDPDAADAAKPPRPDDYGELLEFYRRASATLGDALEATPPSTAVWTWFDADQSAGFVRRRQAHEALIHRLDAELTAGDVTDDRSRAGRATASPRCSTGCTAASRPGLQHDRAGALGRVSDHRHRRRVVRAARRVQRDEPEHRQRPTPTRARSTRVDPGDATFSVSGTARDLDAWLWNRPTRADISLDGDYARFVEIIRSGVQ